ncbi:hypothetical protein BDZ97DRAFT_1915074 [Flammula alnicola]|nr:hypothetical protein BDZ97DRAFT_1915074 [Flammula alnicola]
MSAARLWALFKGIRVLVYSLATFASMGFVAIYAILLIRGWSSYNGGQRSIVIILLAIYVVSSIMLYLMLILRFRLWLDGTRLAFLLLIQVGGTVTFAIFYPSLPCNNLGSVSTCKWLRPSLFSAVVLIFALYLAIMHDVPVPVPRPHPEAILALKLGNDMKPEKSEKRSSLNSLGSASSVYSQESHITPYTYTAPSTLNDARRSPSVAGTPRPPFDPYRARTPGSMHSAGSSASSSHTARPVPSFDYGRSRTPGSLRSSSRVHAVTETTYATAGLDATRQVPPFDHYRSATPASIRSVALTSSSSIRTAPRQRYYYNNGIPAPQPRMPPGINYPPLTQAFNDPISRHGTPMSSLSNTSFYLPQQRHGLAPVGPGLTFPQPPSYYHNPASPTSLPVPLPPQGNGLRPPPSATPTPPSIAIQMREALSRSPSPSIYSPRSIDTISVPSRNGSVSSVPRSPSPETVSFHNLPTTPLSAVLPAHPVLPPAAYNGRYGTPPPEIQRQRYGSVPDINVNDLPVPNNQYHQTGSDYPVPPSRNWMMSPSSDRAGSIDQWRQNTMYNPHPSEGRLL